MQGVLEVALHLRQGAHEAGGLVGAGRIYLAGQLALGDGVGHGQGSTDRLGQAMRQAPGQQQRHQHRQRHDGQHDANAVLIDVGSGLTGQAGTLGIEFTQPGELLLIGFRPPPLFAIGQAERLVVVGPWPG
ncbi:hypothetical protein Q3H58_000728 [Pseudomonas psychrotolerans]|nr:hypothetical protein [Pseudomonas psychrotolerans]